jgi:hypothetical protein
MEFKKCPYLKKKEKEKKKGGRSRLANLGRIGGGSSHPQGAKWGWLKPPTNHL